MLCRERRDVFTVSIFTRASDIFAFTADISIFWLSNFAIRESIFVAISVSLSIASSIFSVISAMRSLVFSVILVFISFFISVRLPSISALISSLFFCDSSRNSARVLVASPRISLRSSLISARVPVAFL